MTQYSTFAAGAITHLNSLAAFGNVQLPFINVKSFQNAAGAWTGAPGTNHDDDDAAIQAAITVATDTTYPGTVYFPPGIYKISTQIPLKNCHVQCAPGAIFKPAAVDTNFIRGYWNCSWYGGAVMVNTLAYTGTVIYIDGAFEGALAPGIGYNARSPVFKSMGLFSAYGGVARGKAIHLDASATAGDKISYSFFDDFSVVGFTDGIYLHTNVATAWVNGNTFTNFRMAVNERHIHLYREAGTSVNSNLFSNFAVQISPETVHGIKLNQSGNNRFMNMSMIDSQNLTEGSEWILEATASSNNNTIMGCGFESPFIKDMGEGNLIQGHTPKTWQGAELTRLEDYYYQPNSGSAIADGGYVSEYPVASGTAKEGDCVLLGFSASTKDCMFFCTPMSTTTLRLSCYNETGSPQTFSTYLRVYLKLFPRSKANHYVTHDFGEIAANETLSQDFSVPGVKRGDLIAVGIDVPTSNFGLLLCSADAKADDTVTISVYNTMSSAVNPASTIFYLFIFPKAKATYVNVIADMASIADGGQLITEVTIPDAELGDFCLSSCEVTASGGLLGLYQWAFIDEAGKIKVGLHNETAGAVDHGEVYMRVMLIKPGDIL